MHHAFSYAFSLWQMVGLLVDSVTDDKHVIDTNAEHHRRKHLGQLSHTPASGKTYSKATS